MNHETAFPSSDYLYSTEPRSPVFPFLPSLSKEGFCTATLTNFPNSADHMIQHQPHMIIHSIPSFHRFVNKQTPHENIKQVTCSPQTTFPRFSRARPVPRGSEATGGRLLLLNLVPTPAPPPLTATGPRPDIPNPLLTRNTDTHTQPGLHRLDPSPLPSGPTLPNNNNNHHVRHPERAIGSRAP